jgi:TolA-binding protein
MKEEEMKNIRAERPAVAGRLTLCLLVLLVCVSAADAGIMARIYKAGGRQAPLQGETRWLGASKVYKIKIQGQEFTIPLNQVDRVEAVKPPQIDEAIKNVKMGRFSSAIPVLKDIQKDYAMLQWDVPATRWLAQAYMGGNDVDNAYSAVSQLKRTNPDALRAPDFFKVYCQILISKNLFGEVENMLSDFIANSEDRNIVAVATMMRGDMAMKKGDYKAALLDGYLRTVYFYQNVTAVQPEALLKTVQCFQKLGDPTKGDKFRSMLLARFPNTPEAREAQSN